MGGSAANGHAEGRPVRRPDTRNASEPATSAAQTARNCGANARYPWTRASSGLMPTSAYAAA